jgi:hypothetical protein
MLERFLTKSISVECLRFDFMPRNKVWKKHLVWFLW